MERHIAIGDYCYDLPEERIAKFPLADRRRAACRGAAGVQQHEGHPGPGHHAQALGRPHRGVLSRTPRPGRLRTGVRRDGQLRVVVHRGQRQEMERGLCRNQLRARGAPRASAGVAGRRGGARAARALRVVGAADVRPAARMPGPDSDSALPEPRERGNRQYALSDRLLEIRGFGRCADGRAALHARTDRRNGAARFRVRGGDRMQPGIRCTPNTSR